MFFSRARRSSKRRIKQRLCTGYEGRHSVLDTNCLSLLGKEDNCGIKRALLEVIASGVVTRPQDVERYAACTFFASVPSQENAYDSDAIIKTTVQFLVQNEFVRLQKCGDADSDENKENENGMEEVRFSYVTLFHKFGQMKGAAIQRSK